MALFELTLVLLFAAVVLAAIARRVGAPYPALLALAGAAIAFVPNAPVIELDPDLALTLFVAPVLLDAAFDTSPRDLRRNTISLVSLVVVMVGLTTAAVAWLGWRYAGLPWAAAIALGAIVAPPDAAAGAAILRQLNLPRRILHILQGESLLNDATALLVYRIAVALALGGVSLTRMAPMVALSVVGSLAAGYVLARLYGVMIGRVRDAASLAVLSFVGTFGVWILAEQLQLSAIVTVVVYAMTLANGVERQTLARNRISTYSVWETVVFVLNVLAFMIMGLQARPILERLADGERQEAIAFALAVLAVVIVVRIVYVLAYNAAVRAKNRRFGVRLPEGLEPPTFKGGVVVAWCGMRGLVTLAAAFALPAGFPGRDTIVLAAFTVVLGTLVLQGFTLGPLISWLAFEPDSDDEREVSLGRTAMLRAAIAGLEGDDSAAAAAVRHDYRAACAIAQDVGRPQGATAQDELRLAAIGTQRETLNRLRASGDIGDEAYHRLQEELDWAELNAAPAGAFQPLATEGEAPAGR